jgi:predicted MFS family arabinose efflux permease
MALLRDRPSFWYIALGSAFASYVAYGNGNFLPSFLIRNHHMSIAEVGTVLALVAGVSGALGTFLGGYLSDRYGTKDMRWYLWIPMIGIALAYFPYLNMLLTDNISSGLALVFFALILNSFYLGPCIALSHALVEPGMRALTSAILLFVLNMIGLGLGPFITGLVSDMLVPAYADQALRYSMVVTTQVYLLALLMFALAARRLPADLAKR